ncbi:hypothetical protein [Mycoplasmopsis columboralis]|uniref:DUF2975 domain-containing protein n=1 Tax=Mycoplasmopsis columboralis TaxID=171282 RepID=A0A449B6R9_9BACT|nr:hypothetical protein [Mycoplasmopsis columboralis]VEU76306.1 Uncharacterised protein [Mycoplasmopsis columboralis]
MKNTNTIEHAKKVKFFAKIILSLVVIEIVLEIISIIINLISRSLNTESELKSILKSINEVLPILNYSYSISMLIISLFLSYFWWKSLKAIKVNTPEEIRIKNKFLFNYPIWFLSMFILADLVLELLTYFLHIPYGSSFAFVAFIFVIIYVVTSIKLANQIIKHDHLHQGENLKSEV